MFTSKGRATRARIVDAAAQQVRDSGFNPVNLDAVGAATSTSRSQLFHYFPEGKRELLRAVFEHEVDELMAAQEPALQDLSSRQAWESWRAGLSDYYFTQGRWTCPITALAALAAATDEELSRWLATGTAAWRQVLAQGVAAVRGRQNATPEDKGIAAMIVSQLQGGLVMGRIDKNPDALKAGLHHLLDWLPREGDLRMDGTT